MAYVLIPLVSFFVLCSLTWAILDRHRNNLKPFAESVFMFSGFVVVVTTLFSILVLEIFITIVKLPYRAAKAVARKIIIKEEG